MDTIVGTASTDGEVTVFILSVQTRALTLWTLDDQQEWSAEFHWYLPQVRSLVNVNVGLFSTPCLILCAILFGLIYTNGNKDEFISGVPMLKVREVHCKCSHNDPHITDPE